MEKICSTFLPDYQSVMENKEKENDIIFPDYLENDDNFDERIDKFLFRLSNNLRSLGKENPQILICADKTVILKIADKFNVHNPEIPYFGHCLKIRNAIF